MAERIDVRQYERRVTPIESLFMRSPYSIVAMVARIKGEVTESMLRDAVGKVQLRHPHLRARIVEDGDHVAWFTSDGAGEIEIEVVPRESDRHWIEVIGKSSLAPFAFDKRPAIRFILVQSPALSELIIFCHHIICDGLSLAYLARDLMLHLGDPTREVEILPDPVPIAIDTIPEGVSVNRIVRFFINRINKKWARERVFFDQEDYESLNATYWTNYKHQVLTAELSEDQTAAIVDRCRRENVTVNSALIAAFVGAQATIQGGDHSHPGITTAGSLRDRLRSPAGEAMGFYAGAVTLNYQYNTRTGFWENAREVHKKVKPLVNNKHLFGELLTWCYLDPTILHAIPFKLLGGLTSQSSSSYQKLTDFHSRDDTVLSVLKRNKMESLDRVSLGTAVTNLTWLDFPRKYGALELDRLIMKPGGAFPLTTVKFTLGVVTCAGKLSLLAEFVEQNLDVDTMDKIKDTALAFLLDLGA